MPAAMHASSCQRWPFFAHLYENILFALDPPALSLFSAYFLVRVCGGEDMLAGKQTFFLDVSQIKGIVCWCVIDLLVVGDSEW